MPMIGTQEMRLFKKATCGGVRQGKKIASASMDGSAKFYTKRCTIASVRAVWPNRPWQAVSSGLYASTWLQNTYDNSS